MRLGLSLERRACRFLDWIHLTEWDSLWVTANRGTSGR
jgi:hypothetical protein